MKSSLQAGVSHGLMVAVPAAGAATGAAVAPQAYYWPWWHIGFFPFGLLIWVFVFRLLFGCGFGRRWYYRHGPYDGPYNGPGWFDEWHQRAHERMNNPPKA